MSTATVPPPRTAPESAAAEYTVPRVPREPRSESATLHGLVAEQARRTPNAPALIPARPECGERTLSYAELDALADHRAARLVADGVRPGDIVALCLPRGVDLLACLLAVLKAGGAYVAVEPDHPADRLRRMLADADVRTVLAAPVDRQRLHASGVLPPDAAVLTPGQLDAPGPLAPLPALVPEDAAYAIFTSGSTGRPKGLTVGHRAIVDRVRWLREHTPLDTGDRVLQKTSYSFDVSVGEIFWPLACGAALVVLESGAHRDPARLAEAVREHRVSVLHFVPSMLEVFLLEPATAALPPLRYLMVAGEALPEHLVAAARRVLDTRLLNLYGPSEATVYATAWTCPEQQPYGKVSIGTVLDRVTAVVLDEHGDTVPPGVPGELHLGGRGLADGYVNRPELTADMFVPDPAGPPGSRRYRTGDLAAMDADGVIDYLGRIDHQVKIRGFRIELGEVTAALLDRLPVAQAAVLPNGSEELVAYLVPRPGTVAPDAEEARAAVAPLLPDYMVPGRWFVLPELPLTPNGKLDRAALPRPAAAEHPAAPPDADTLTGLWCRTVGPADDPDADAFALGASSLAVARLLASVRAELGVDLRYDVFAARPTLRALTEAAAGAVPTAPGETGIPTGLRPDPARAPLHPGQRRLWLLDRLRPLGPGYNVLALRRLRGPLDPAALDAAFRDVVDRHQALRTTIRAENGVPVQHIAPRAETGLTVTVLPSDRPEAAHAWADELAARELDIADGPAYLAGLARGADDDHWLLLSLHHLVADGWSLEILLRDLGDCYRARTGRALPPPPPAAQYGDIAAWAERQAGGARHEEALDHWRTRLADAPTTLDLPWRGTPEPPRGTALRHSRTLPPELSERLRAAARHERVTPAALALAAYAVTLSRWTGTDDLLIGTPLAGRDHPDLADAVGFFNQTVVLRMELAGLASGRAALRAAAGELARATAHQQASFDEVVAALGGPRDPGGNPLFQAWFNVLNYQEQRLDLPGVEVEPLPAPLPGVLFDLGLYVADQGRDVTVELVHDQDRLDGADGELIHRHILDLLERIATDPAAPLADPGALPAVRRAGAPAAAAPLAARIADHAGRTPERPAVHGPDGSLDYRTLVAGAEELAEVLRAHGAGPHTAVAVHGAPDTGFPVALLAVRRTGAAVVVLDPAHPPQWRAAQQEQVRPVAVVAPVPGRPGELTVESTPWTGTDARLPDHGAQPAYVSFTSGTTARPRPVIGAEPPVTAFLDWYARRYGLTAEDRFCLLSGYGHDPAWRDLWTPLWLGAGLHIPPAEVRAEPHALLGWLRTERVTVLHLTPVTAQLLVAAARDTADTLDAVRLVCFAGDALPWSTVAAVRRLAPRARTVNFYGVTETPQAATAHEIGEVPAVDGTVPVGAAGAASELVLRRPDGSWAAPGERAEIWVRCTLPTLGYLHDPGTTAARYLPDPWGEPGARLVRTGDFGRLRADGTVQVEGRTDAQVKVRGNRVDPRQLEACLRGLQGVAHALATAATVQGAVRLVAAVVPEERVAGEVTAASVRARVRAVLPGPLVPETVLLLPALPVTANGKADLAAVRALAVAEAEQPRADGGHDRPAGPAGSGSAAALRRLWEEVLGVSGFGDDANFFDLGGTSLTVLQVHGRLTELTQREVPAVALFQYSTVRALAAFLDEGAEHVDGGRDRVRERSGWASREAAQRRRAARRA
ncbi:amino acid adenylation domain-containing protein [Kitasatospora sp. NPDC085879]|uniref:amino acid adenylation domain-containing protein n=1 Tax=Kitasatospora sp. NPDC085879 TaxID=3154769 RepID=UPI00342C6C08